MHRLPLLLSLVSAPVGADVPFPLQLEFDITWEVLGAPATAGWTLYEDHTFANSLGVQGTWSWDPGTEVLVVQYDSGTRYEGTRTSGFCLAGDATAPGGVYGTWDGCLVL